MAARTEITSRDGARIALTDHGGSGRTVLLLHGLAGSARELRPTADALTDAFHVLSMDQRGHGRSSRRPDDLSREAFVADVVAAIEQVCPAERVALVGQSMGAHTAFLTAAARPDLVHRLVMLEGHAAGSDRPDEAAELGQYFASWPHPFADADAARAFLGDSALSEAWIADLERGPDGLHPRFDADVMERAIAAVHHPRWGEWEALRVPTSVVFADGGMFTEAQKSELVARRPGTRRLDIVGASHDAHLDAFERWIEVLRAELSD